VISTGSVPASRPVGVCPGALVVGQDERWLGLCERLLRELDPRWSVQSSSLHEAVARLARLDSPPDLVIVDPADDHGCGIGFLHALRDRFDAVPVLALSDDASAERLLEAIRAGARGYLLKDRTDASLLMQAIARVMDGAYPVSPALVSHLFALARSVTGEEPAPSTEVTMQRLSPRERELLCHLSRGSSYAEAASAMGVKLSTVQSHVRHLYRKLAVQSGIQAVNLARARGLI
jgi:two-component system nitrate/nitrite response regulator NarL